MTDRYLCVPIQWAGFTAAFVSLFSSLFIVVYFVLQGALWYLLALALVVVAHVLLFIGLKYLRRPAMPVYLIYEFLFILVLIAITVLLLCSIIKPNFLCHWPLEICTDGRRWAAIGSLVGIACVFIHVECFKIAWRFYHFLEGKIPRPIL